MVQGEGMVKARENTEGQESINCERAARSPVFQTGRHFWLLLGFFGLLLLAKDPDTLLHPRFWAEEATVHLNYAYSHGPLEALTFYYPPACRFELIMNMGVSLASVLPMKYAPYATAGLSFFAFLLAFALFLRRSLDIFESPTKKILGCFALLFCCYSLPELFLTTAVIEPTLAVLAMAILLSKTETLNLRQKVMDTGLLIVCGLSSTYTNFLAPAFFVKAAATRQRHDLLKFVVLAVCTCLQLWLMVSSRDKSYLQTYRGFQLSVTKTAEGLLYVTFVKPFLGEQGSEWLKGLGVAREQMFVLPLLALVAVAGLLWILLRANYLKNWLLAVAWLFSTAGAAYGAVGGIPDGRYATVSRTLLLFFIIENIHLPSLIWKGAAPGRGLGKTALLFAEQSFLSLLVVCAFAVGLSWHFRPMPSQFTQVPCWTEEVRNLDTYKNYLMTVYPAPRWKADFREKKYRTALPRIEPGREYSIDELVPWLDYYQVHQRPLAGSDRRYIQTSTLTVELAVREEGNYRLKGFFLVAGAHPGYWHLRRETPQRRTIRWSISPSLDWTWQEAPEVWRLKPGNYLFLLEPGVAAPISALKVERIL